MTNLKNGQLVTGELTAEERDDENRVKALLFSQYLGCNVDISATEYYQIDKERLTDIKLQGLRLDPKPLFFIKTNLTAHNDGNIRLIPDVCKLILRSVDMLDDEEIIEIYYLMNPKALIDIASNNAIKNMHIGILKRMLIDGDTFGHRTIDMCGSVYDYLRSISVLTCFTYLTKDKKPVTLQPDQLIQLGWAKLLTSK